MDRRCFDTCVGHQIMLGFHLLRGLSVRTHKCIRGFLLMPTILLVSELNTYLTLLRRVGSLPVDHPRRPRAMVGNGNLSGTKVLAFVAVLRHAMGEMDALQQPLFFWRSLEPNIFPHETKATHHKKGRGITYICRVQNHPATVSVRLLEGAEKYVCKRVNLVPIEDSIRERYVFHACPPLLFMAQRSPRALSRTAGWRSPARWAGSRSSRSPSQAEQSAESFGGPTSAGRERIAEVEGRKDGGRPRTRTATQIRFIRYV